MHACAERFFRVNTPHPPSLEKLLQFYEENWISEGYETPEDEARYREYGREILARFVEIHRADFRMPVAIERRFNIDIDGVKLRGIIDRIDKLDSGGLSIVDYKTNKEIFSVEHLAEDLQLTIYQIAAEKTWQLPVEKLTLYHLRSNTPFCCPPRPAEQVDEARRIILDVAEKIEHGEFPATEHEFCPCDFPEHCPYYRHRFLEAAPELAPQGLLSGINAVDAVEKYAKLQTQIKELQAQLEETRQKIIEYCQSSSINRVYGNTCDVTCKISERTGFDEDGVRSVLEAAGLWEKVVGLDQSRLKQLLADKSLDRSIRDKLESLRRVTSAFPQLWVKKHEEEDDQLP
jgi:RecB family exonuclease